MRRAILLLLAIVLLDARPAGAHNVTGIDPTNYVSKIVAVSPRVPGLQVRVLDLGQRLEIRNRTGSPLTVVDAQGEAGRRIPDGRTVRIDDDRTVYEGPKPSGGRRVVGSWTIELLRGESRIGVSGVITYVPGPSPWPWVALVVVLIVGTVGSAWSRRWGRWLSVALALLLASDLIHSFATAASTEASVAAQIGRVLLAGLVTAAAWVVGVISMPALQRNNEGGLVAAAAVGLVIAVFSGIADLGSFTNSQLPGAFPADAARVAVSMALGLGAGLVGAAVAVIARDPALRPTVVTRTDGTGP